MYAVGGNDGVASLSSVERFDPHLNKWTEVKEMGQRRAGNGVSELNGCLYVVGEISALLTGRCTASCLPETVLSLAISLIGII